MDGAWNLLLDVVVLLGAALILGGLLARLGQSPLVGYILAGMILGGPGSIRLVKSEKEIEAIAELGVSLLLFSLGLEFSWSRLRALGSRALLGGVIQVVVTLLVATVVTSVFGLRFREAIAVGAMVTLSSTAAVLRVLMVQGEIDSAHGRHSLAILLVQDVAVVPLALLMTILAGGGAPGEILWDIGRLLALAMGLILGLYLLLNWVAVWALNASTLERNRELTVLLTLVVGLGSTWAAHSVGLSPALGAFVAGMFLGSSPFAIQIRADVSSLRVALLTLFFGAAGMVADPVWMLQNWYLILALTALLLVIKALVIWAILRALGMASTIALATGLCLCQIGEFAFVLGSAGRESGIVSPEIHMMIVSTTIVSLLTTPFIVPLAPRLALWITQRLPRGSVSSPEAPDRPHHVAPDVVIIGFGPAGRLAGQILTGRPEQVLVVDLNKAATHKAKELGFHIVIGDASQLDVLEHLHLQRASVIIVTIPARTAAITVVHHLRRLAPQARIVARSRYQLYKVEFESAGAHVIVGDEEEVGNRLASRVLEQLTPVKPTTPESEENPD